MSVKDKVKKQNQVKEEKVESKVSRKSAGAGTENAQGKAERDPAVVTRILGGNNRDPQWYLKHEGELEMVTDEDSNEALGINKIYANAASEKQMHYGTIANITLETVIGKVTGLQVRESQKQAGAIFLTESSRDISKEGQDARWVSDVQLDKKVKAQVLSYVETLLVDAE